MVLTILTFLIALVAAGVAISFVVRHWHDLALLDPSSLKDEQERQRREAMILRRFERMRSDKVRPFKRAGRAFSLALDRAYKRLHSHVRSMETLYQSAKQPFANMAPTTVDRIKTLITEARALTRDLKWSEAERRYLEAISLDSRNAEAYRGLGQMYVKQKLYPQAKETFQYLIRLKKEDDATFSGLAEIAEAEGKMDEALRLRTQAVVASPKQPHRQAELAEFYLRRKEPKKALAAADEAVKLEPASARYLELSLEAAILVRDRKEAERLYDRLRLLADDTSRFRAWKEKIEEIE